MGAYFLKEEVRTLGRLGCATCLLGSIMLVLHAPPDKEIQGIDEIIHLSIQPLFLLYCAVVTAFSSYMIYVVAPKSGKTNPLVYISICSSVGSISVMAVKAFSIAVKLTIGGENQFSHPSTYVFLIVLVVTLLTQMNYLNKAMDVFPASLINAMFYVLFTTCTLSASFILYGGFNTTELTTTVSLVCGFLLNFFGIALLTLSKTDVQAGDYTLGGNIGFSATPMEMGNLGYARVSTSRNVDSQESEDGHSRNRRSVTIR